MSQFICLVLSYPSVAAPSSEIPRMFDGHHTMACGAHALMLVSVGEIRAGWMVNEPVELEGEELVCWIEETPHWTLDGLPSILASRS